MSAHRYGVRLGSWCAEIAEKAGLVDRREGVLPARRNDAGGANVDHDHIVFAMPNRSSARQLVSRVLRAFDARKPKAATRLLRRAHVVRLGEHPSHVKEILS